VDWDTPVSRTPIVSPGSLARERTLLRGQRAGGPQKLLGPPTARVNRAVRGPCEDAEVVGTWRPCGWRSEATGRSCVVGGVMGIFEPSHQGRHFRNRALPPTLKLSREGSSPSSTAHRRRHLPSEDLAHPNPLSLSSSRCDSPLPKAMAPRRATGAARSSEAAP
jgi:hypothetical protein